MPDCELPATAIPLYCLTYRNVGRKRRMSRRFARLGITPHFVQPPDCTPPETVLAAARTQGRWNLRAWSCAHGHMAMIGQFLRTGGDVAVFCEDDVYLHRDFAALLASARRAFDVMDHDVMLLGCLSPEKPPGDTLSYRDYGEDQWGTQMYMLRRRYAVHLQNEYDGSYALRSLTDASLTPFSADWLITKDTKRRSMVLPMLAVEEGPIEDTNAQGHVLFHRLCHEAQYDPALYM
jgi:hypothetical protein